MSSQSLDVFIVYKEIPATDEDIWKKFFTARHWLPREAVDAPFLEVFKARLYKLSLPMLGERGLEVNETNPIHSIIF